jgi:hypothetical protein
MIAKPGKPPTETNSYRPISLLPILSKVFKRLILKRLEETVPINDIIPMHQFGFLSNTPQSNGATESSIKEKKAWKERKYVPASSLTFNRISTKYGIKDYCINSKRTCLISCILL